MQLHGKNKPHICNIKYCNMAILSENGNFFNLKIKPLENSVFIFLDANNAVGEVGDPHCGSVRWGGSSLRVGGGDPHCGSVGGDASFSAENGSARISQRISST